MTTTTTDRACPICQNGRVKHYRSGFATQMVRCGCCKGTARVSAAAWLKAFRAMPRTMATRRDAIERACGYLGRHSDGTVDATRGGCEILENGFGGMIADLRAQGFGDVADRAKAAYLADRTCETAEGFEAFVAEVVAARAELTAKLAA